MNVEGLFGCVTSGNGERRHNGVLVERVSGRKRLELSILSEFVVCGVHWHASQSVPCVGVTCPYCIEAQPRVYAWAAAIDCCSRRLLVQELPAYVALEVGDLALNIFKEWGASSPYRLDVWREGGRPKGQVQYEFSGARGPGKWTAIDHVIRVLCRMWKVPAPAEPLDSGAQVLSLWRDQCREVLTQRRLCI